MESILKDKDASFQDSIWDALLTLTGYSLLFLHLSFSGDSPPIKIAYMDGLALCLFRTWSLQGVEDGIIRNWQYWTTEFQALFSLDPHCCVSIVWLQTFREGSVLFLIVRVPMAPASASAFACSAVFTNAYCHRMLHYPLTHFLKPLWAFPHFF